MAILLALAIVVDCMMNRYEEIIQSSLGENSNVSSEEYQQEASENAKNINIETVREGVVLLKNDGDALPLTDDTVNVYGVISGSMIMNSTGSSSSNERSESFKTALEQNNITVNPAIWSLLEANTSGSADMSGIVENSIASSKQELSLAQYENVQSFSEAKRYSEIAIVTIGRSSGEGADPYRGYGATAGQLELQEREIQLLKKLHDEGFTVVTLINSSLVIELGPVNAYSDAILWIGGVGINGVQGVADVLAGKMSPSGRLVDTWMYEQETSSSYYSSWAAQYELVDGKATLQNQNAYVDENGNIIGYYTNYNEGIYVGYKWYETADKEGFWDDYTCEFTGDATGYEAVVAYPFGYGLSYTEFTEEILSASASYNESTKKIELSVKVVNTGSAAAKDVVEIYVEKPYENGKEETSVVELVGFAKTNTLAKDGEETVSFIIDRDDLATFSEADGCYKLLGGDYRFYVASGETGAHIWKTADESRTFIQHFDEVKYDESARSSDAAVAKTQLATTENDSGIASNDATAGYRALSRKDKFSNAGSTILASAMASISGKVKASSQIYQRLVTDNDKYNTAHLSDLIDEGITAAVEQNGELQYSDLYYGDAEGNLYYEIDEQSGETVVTGAMDYNDSRWDALLGQISVDKLKELIGRGGYGTIALDAIGKIKYSDYDGPTGFTNYMKATLGQEQSTTSFCSEAVMASTWNAELIEEVGAAIGMEGNAWNMSGIYAPGLNMHRTPFGGRAGEYFSEDAYISGMMAAYEVRGLSSKGVMAYAKHFAFNDIEYQRTSKMNIVIGEQAAREIYLKAFELCVKNSNLNGIMTSYMYINGMWTGSNFNLITNIARKEWGFNGVFITDAAVSSMMTASKSLCAGCDLMLSNGYGKTATYAYLNVADDILNTEAGIKALKTSAKRILYAIGSNMLHRDIEEQESDYTMLNALYITLNVVGYGGFGVLTALFVLFLVRDLRRKRVRTEQIEESGGANTIEG